jgi:serine/threonine protein kinase
LQGEKAYRIIKYISSGASFHTVYFAIRLSDNKKFVIKRYSLDRMSTSDVRMLWQEFEIMKRIDHPFVVKIVDYYSYKEKFVHIVTEYLPDGDL